MAVASLGTAFTNEQANLIKKYTKNVYLAYDSDGAGTKAALRAIGILRQYGLSGKVINMQPYKDPDEFMKALGKEAFEERIEKAENSFLFEIRILQRDFDLSDPEGKTQFFREVAQKLCHFQEALERDNYMHTLAGMYQVKYEDLLSLVRTTAANNEGLVRRSDSIRSGNNRKREEEAPILKKQRYLLTWITEEPELLPKISKYITPDDFTEEIYREIAVEIYTKVPEGTLNAAMIISRYEDLEQQNRVAEIFQSSIPALETKEEKEKALHDVIYAIKENSYHYNMDRMGNDISALTKVIEGKKALEELARTNITL